jgi:hypothetical protein
MNIVEISRNVVVIEDTVMEACSSESDREVAQRMIATLKGVNGNDDMLETAFIVWQRLHKTINHLSAKVQWDILYEATMIAYDARIAAFDHVNNYTDQLMFGNED